MVVADSYDVVVLGSGIAGLATVLAASERGLCPLLIEKSEKLGGGTTNSYGLIWIGDNHLARAAGYEDNRADVVRYMRFLAGGEERDANLLAFVDWSPRALQFFESCGVSFRLTHGITDHYYGVASGAGGEGRTVEAELLSGYDLGAWRDRGACRWEFHSSSLRKSRSPGAVLIASPIGIKPAFANARSATFAAKVWG